MLSVREVFDLKKIFQKDCLKVMETASENSIDMILTDPPYAMNYVSGRRKEKFSNIQNDDNLNWLDEFFELSHKVLKENSSMYVFCSWHNIDKFKIAFERYFKLKNVLVWVKNNHGSGDLKAGYAPKYEFILYGHKGRSLFRNGRHADVLNFNKVSGSKLLHPTEKPIDLLEFLIQNNSDKGDKIFDPFMGSGTTGIACKNLDRFFIGCELDGNYFNIAKDRLEN